MIKAMWLSKKLSIPSESHLHRYRGEITCLWFALKYFISKINTMKKEKWSKCTKILVIARYGWWPLALHAHENFHNKNLLKIQWHLTVSYINHIVQHLNPSYLVLTYVSSLRFHYSFCTVSHIVFQGSSMCIRITWDIR